MFNMNEIITKKRDGEKLSAEEIKFFVEGYTKGDIPDYQASQYRGYREVIGMEPIFRP